VSFSTSSTASIKHYKQNGLSVESPIKTYTPPLSSGLLPVSPSFQYSGSPANVAGTGTSSAQGSIGAFTSSTVAGFTISAGTAVTQLGTGWSDYSILKFPIDGTWTATSPQFGPTAMGRVTFNFKGGVANKPGAFAQYLVDLSFTDPTKSPGDVGYDERAPISSGVGGTGMGSFGPGASFNVAFDDQKQLLGGILATGKAVHIKGTIELRSRDDGDTTISVDNFEAGVSSPTSTLVSTSGNSNWYDAGAWTSGGVVVAAPNAADLRASLLGNTAVQQISIQSSPTVIGTLDIDDANDVTIASSGAALTLDVTAGNAEIFVRNIHGNASHTISAALSLNDNVEVRNDSAGVLTFSGPVSGTGGIIKEGLGTLSLSGPAGNTYAGATTINSGFVDVDKASAIPGAANVNGGQLNYNVAAAVAGQITAGNNGQVNVNAPLSPGQALILNDLGCVSGSGSLLSTLVVGGGLTLSTGAMIAHQTFDTGIAGNPAGLPAQPTVIFGISTDFNTGSAALTFGSLSGTPWIGFGGDRGVRIFGSNATTTSHTLTVMGAGQLVSLAGELVLNGQVNGDGSSSLNKRGAGLVSINNVSNTYAGSINVEAGALAINGSIGPSQVTVQDGATLGGDGSLNSPVSVLAGGHLSPGAQAPTRFSAGTFSPTATIGTLHVGNLTLNSTSQLDYELDVPNTVGSHVNDLTTIQGNLVLDGVLNLSEGPSFGEGTYTLMTFTGSLADNGLSINNKLVDIGGMQIVIVPIVGGGGNVVLQSHPGLTTAAWNADADGEWTSFSNWSTGVPNNIAGAVANFGTIATAARTVLVDSPEIVSQLNFSSPNKYTLGGGAVITLNNNAGTIGVTVSAGSHEIDAPLALAKSATFSVSPAGSTLTVANLQPTAFALTKSGAGKLTVNNVRAAALTVNAGVVSVLAGRSTARTSKVNGLVVSPGATLDLADQDMIFDYAGGSPAATLRGYLVSGYNLGAWNGPGINSSAAAASAGSRALGYAEAVDVLAYSGGTASFSGQTLTDTTALLVRYTLPGDSNLSGTVDLTDFTYLAANFNSGSGTWLKGDYNYDGSVTLTDFTYLAANFNHAFPAAESGLGAVIPEPAASAGLMLLGMVRLMRRRRARLTRVTASSAL
jgi:fibronectin-binding autotransporter adhesin